ncbi:hypothetical protein ACLOJK_011331 [Asimina triloba]
MATARSRESIQVHPITANIESRACFGTAIFSISNLYRTIQEFGFHKFSRRKRYPHDRPQSPNDATHAAHSSAYASTKAGELAANPAESTHRAMGGADNPPYPSRTAQAANASETTNTTTVYEVLLVINTSIARQVPSSSSSVHYKE